MIGEALVHGHRQPGPAGKAGAVWITRRRAVATTSSPRAASSVASAGPMAHDAPVTRARRMLPPSPVSPFLFPRSWEAARQRRTACDVGLRQAEISLLRRHRFKPALRLGCRPCPTPPRIRGESGGRRFRHALGVPPQGPPAGLSPTTGRGTEIHRLARNAGTAMLRHMTADRLPRSGSSRTVLARIRPREARRPIETWPVEARPAALGPGLIEQLLGMGFLPGVPMMQVRATHCFSQHGRTWAGWLVRSWSPRLGLVSGRVWGPDVRGAARRRR
jgi:hypothetical protein